MYLTRPKSWIFMRF